MVTTMIYTALMAATIVTWNINSIRMRVHQLYQMIEEKDPDVILLQETKVQDHQFPINDLAKITTPLIGERQYHIAFCGMKSYNGVAIISRYPCKNIVCALSDPEDQDFARYIACDIEFSGIGNIWVNSVYVPNGRALGTTFFEHKLRFLERLLSLVKERKGQRIIVGGDINIAPREYDIYEGWPSELLVSEQERSVFEAFIAAGMKDALYEKNSQIIDDPYVHAMERMYTWWDYRNNAFMRNMGGRIDHILVSDNMEILEADIWRDLRKVQTPSDHAPIWCKVQ